MTNDKALEAALPGEAEVVGLAKRLNRWRSETVNQWSDEYEPRTSWERQVSDAMKEWYEASTQAANALQAMHARAEAAERERDEAVDWTATVERHGADGFDDLAEAWLALPAIQRTTNAAISTFSKWANEDLMARFKKNQLAMFHLAFVEGCLAGVRTESVLSKTAEARVKELEEALSHALDHYDRNTCLHESVHRGGSIWTICDDCGRQWADDKGGFQLHVDPTEISAARTALKGGSNG